MAKIASRKALKEPAARVAAVKSAAAKVSAKTSIDFVRSVRGR
jgi:hypothetical protein